jgi:hypothetical protein
MINIHAVPHREHSLYPLLKQSYRFYQRLLQAFNIHIRHRPIYINVYYIVIYTVELSYNAMKRTEYFVSL